MVNDTVYCAILDMGVDPGIAYEIAFIEMPNATEYDRPDFGIDLNMTEDYDHLTAIYQ